MGLLAVILSVSGMVFHRAVSAQRTADATAQIARKLRAITDQLNADFKGLRDEGEILMAWVPVTLDSLNSLCVIDCEDYENDDDGYVRFDTIMFFTEGDFQSYSEWPVEDLDNPTNPEIRILNGNIARVSYMLAKNAADDTPQNQPAAQRILARTQHILVAENIVKPNGDELDFPNLTTFDPEVYKTGNNEYEFEEISLAGWKNVDPATKEDMMSVIIGLRVGSSTFTGGGVTVDVETPENTTHMLLAEGVGEFKVQIWYDDGVNPPSWYPEIDPDGDGDLSDSDFVINEIDDESGPTYPGRWYPGTGDFGDWAKALKFIFTLYDSRGIFKDGKKFTHIVYLEN